MSARATLKGLTLTSSNDDNGAAMRRGMGTLGQKLGRVSGAALRRRGFAEATIITDWATIVGRPLADHSQPSRIAFPRGERIGGTLHLRVSGAFAPEISHLAPQIIERINAHFGYGAVRRLELHHGYTPPPGKPRATPGDAAPDPAVAAAIGRVEDERLKAALDRLARARAGALRKDGK